MLAHAEDHSRRDLRLRGVRRHRRPDAAQAAAGALLPVPRRPDARRTRASSPRRAPTSDDDAYRERASKALQRACRARGPRQRHRRSVLPAALLRPAGCDRSRTADWHALADMLDAGARARLLSRDLARSLRPDLPQHRRARPGHRTVARGAGEADRPRPRLGARDQRPGRRGVQRGADLPHRPLPRQGDGAEPAGAALRQHDLRAAVECRRDRPRADHGGRDGRRRAARRLLRPLRRAARHGAEPHAAAAVPDRDGAAGVAGRRSGARREAEGAARAAPDRAA